MLAERSRNHVSVTHETVDSSNMGLRWLILSLAVTMTIAIGLAMLMLFWPYSTREFRGDAKIEDTGFWTYPRYHVAFGRMSLTEPGKQVFRCSGLPPKPLTFQLQIDGKGNYVDLSSLDTIVDIRLRTSDGEIVGEASGPLHEWVLAWTPAFDSGAFWHPRLRDIRVQRNQEYTLTVIVKDVDSNSPPLEVQPTLTGGGNELP